jgi:Fe-S-cluster containining protein
MIFECTKCAGCCSNKNISHFNLDYWGLKEGENGSCSFLKEDNTCGIYEKRPLICRIEKMFDRKEEIRCAEPLMYSFLSSFKSKKDYFKFADRCCNYIIDSFGLDDKYKKK